MSDAVHDLNIVNGLRQGDSFAWDALCQKYGERVWRHLARLVGRDVHVVSDLFQETMLAAAQSGRRMSVDCKLWPWLSGIAHNQAALHWRKSYRRREVYAAADASQTSDEKGGPHPVDSLLHGELVDEVRVALSEMNAEYAALLTAKYLDELSIAEIVESQGGTRESVRSKLARARREFRAQFRHMEN